MKILGKYHSIDDECCYSHIVVFDNDEDAAEFKEVEKGLGNLYDYINFSLNPPSREVINLWIGTVDFRDQKVLIRKSITQTRRPYSNIYDKGMCVKFYSTEGEEKVKAMYEDWKKREEIRKAVQNASTS